MTRPRGAAGVTVAALAIAAVAAVGCIAADAPVLTAGPTLTSCAAVLERQSDVQACAFDGVCSWTDPPAPNGAPCCTYFALCADGHLLVEPMCAPDCRACMDDTACAPGSAWCDGRTCVACPDPAMCPPCGPGTVPVMRNGCATCTCAPPSECTDPAACDPQRAETCYRGQVCADGCAAGDLGCCANVCAAPGCAEPAPLGCRMTCTPELGCDVCMATACTCGDGVWQCTAVCSDVVGPCFLP